MILKTEYRDYYKPYTIREKTKKEKADEDLKKHLVNLPHVDRSHYSVINIDGVFYVIFIEHVYGIWNECTNEVQDAL